jgi:sugar O-acyltransferase (sialic acid O-acetyltransferase NeuD family)
MKKNLVIFGSNELAELSHYYFSNDSDYNIQAFCLDGEYIKESSFLNLPVIAFEELSSQFPPDANSLFVALSYSKINALRKEKFLVAKSLGYELPSYISPKASILNEGAIGENCFILEDNTIQPFVKIGNNVTLWSGNHIGHHSVIHDHTFIASHVVVSGGVEIGEQCFIGVNATLRDHIKIGSRCVLGAGSLILNDVEDEGVYIGKSTERSRVPSSRLRGI